MHANDSTHNPTPTASSRHTMVFSREEVEEIATECFATDVRYKYETVKSWSEERLRDFFESGGDAHAEVWHATFEKNAEQLLARVEAHASGVAAEPLASDELDGCLAELGRQEQCLPLRRLLLEAMLQSLAATGSHDGSAARHFAALFAVACSSSPETRLAFGPFEDVLAGLAGRNRALMQQGAQPRCQTHSFAGSVGVLLIGFGGSSLGSMAAYEKLYASLRPAWAVFTHAGPLLVRAAAGGDIWGEGTTEEPPSAAALDAVLSGAYACERLIVHLQSNQAHIIWCHLLRREGAGLAARVAAMVYDCSAASGAHVTAQMWPSIAAKTLGAALRAYDVAPPASAALLVEAATAHARQTPERECERVLAAPDATFEYQVRHDPPSPALLLSSSEDTVVPLAGVRHFADMLRRAQPKRSVRLVELAGAHVQLLAREPSGYRAALEALLSEAGLASSQAQR